MEMLRYILRKVCSMVFYKKYWYIWLLLSISITSSSCRKLVEDEFPDFKQMPTV